MNAGLSKNDYADVMCDFYKKMDMEMDMEHIHMRLNDIGDSLKRMQLTKQKYQKEYETAYQMICDKIDQLDKYINDDMHEIDEDDADAQMNLSEMKDIIDKSLAEMNERISKIETHVMHDTVNGDIDYKRRADELEVLYKILERNLISSELNYKYASQDWDSDLQAKQSALAALEAQSKEQQDTIASLRATIATLQYTAT